MQVNNMDRKVDQMLQDKRTKMGATRSLGNKSDDEMPLQTSRIPKDSFSHLDDA